MTGVRPSEEEVVRRDVVDGRVPRADDVEVAQGAPAQRRSTCEFSGDRDVLAQPLADELGLAVGRLRRRRCGLVHQRDVGRAVHGGRRGEHERSDPRTVALLEQHTGALDVHAVEVQRPADRDTGVLQRPEVHHPGDAVLPQGRRHHGGVSDGALDDGHAAGNERAASGGEVVEDDRVDAGRPEGAHDVRPDVAGAASDQPGRHARSSPVRRR
jgi:hypothetical protein